MFRSYTIVPCDDTHCEFRICDDGSEGYADVESHIEDFWPGFGQVYELGVDELPGDIEDIRGKIRNQRGRIFGFFGSDRPHYFAVISD